MSLVKWEPFGDIDDFFEDSNFFTRDIGGNISVDIYEKGTNVIVEMNVPGVDPKEVDIEVEDHHLRVSGSHKEEKEEKDKNYYRREIKKGSFQRIVPLPVAVEEEKARAEYEDGVLTITLPKVAKTKPKKKKVAVVAKSKKSNSKKKK